VQEAIITGQPKRLWNVLSNIPTETGEPGKEILDVSGLSGLKRRLRIMGFPTAVSSMGCIN
jgi:hypothetical protein